MENYKSFFKNKKITVMGLGLLGRGIGDVAFLAECGARLTVTDLKTKEQLKESLKKLKKFKNIKYVLGGHRVEDFKNKDMILKSAGVSLDSVYIKEAVENKIPVEMSATLFAKMSGIPMIAVTGTRGKSTVTHMIEHILKSARKKARPIERSFGRVILGGNVRGVSNLQLLKQVKKDSIGVFELDSWQLQGFGDSKISPHISVFTTFFADHMKYYENDMKKYFSDKANIFKYQKRDDILVVGSQALPFIKKWGGKFSSKVITPKENLPEGFVLNIPGEHNIYNANLALEVARNIGIKDSEIKKALANFKSVGGRLELVRNFKGVKYYNDTTATTPEASTAAIHSLCEDHNIILIAGGSDKGLDMSGVVKEMNRCCKGIFLLSGTGTEKIKLKLKNAIEVDSMKKAVILARKVAMKGDVVLLSPAFASFGMFKNEYDRGDQYVKIVKSLK